MKNELRPNRFGVRLLLLFWPFLFVGSTCSKPVTSTTAAPPAQTSGPTVTLPDGYAVHVETAADEETRAQGLMFRDSVREGTGMLFLFPEAGDFPFWMKNTLVPLDMIWIDDQRRVVHVAADVPPCKADPCPSYPPGAVAKYVLELGGGQAAKHKVTTGAVLRFNGLEGIVVR